MTAKLLPDRLVQLDFPATPVNCVDLSVEEMEWVLQALTVTRDDVLFVGRSIYDTIVQLSPTSFSKMGIINYDVVFKLGMRGLIVTCEGGKRSKREASDVTGDARFDFLSRFFCPRCNTILQLLLILHIGHYHLY